MAFFKVTLVRSAIGLNGAKQRVLDAMGLRKRNSAVFLPLTRDSAGQIMAVKELVAVKEVEQAQTRREMHEARRPDPGYYIEKSVNEESNATPSP